MYQFFKRPSGPIYTLREVAARSPTDLERLNRLETDLSDCAEVAENVAVDAGAGDPNSDVPHRASVLETALRAVTEEVKDLRAQVDDR